VHGDGTATRDFTYVDDVIDGLIRCASVPAAAGRTFNLGAGSESTVAELAAAIVRVTNSRSEILSVPGRPWDTVRRRRADVRSAAVALGWSPACPLEPGLRMTAAWLRDLVADTGSSAVG
jgi:nucleoside-diphosphate-sugar epimerase